MKLRITVDTELPKDEVRDLIKALMAYSGDNCHIIVEAVEEDMTTAEAEELMESLGLEHMVMRKQ